ncbi:hypothetical protein E4T49_07573 [Aureobasidium sp. EXF-10728]|nr:hypothetical protein E4T49_07573 [Aureobasidium sp. EXF-10728]
MAAPAGQRPFACLQCTYEAKNRLHMESHIANKHVLVKPWACNQANCGEKFARPDWLSKHVLAAHGRNLRPAEEVPDAAILASIKDEAARTEVAAQAPPPAVLAPPGPPVVAPLGAPAVEGAVPALSRMVGEPIPGYYLHYGLPYGTGPVIPGGLSDDPEPWIPDGL